MSRLLRVALHRRAAGSVVGVVCCCVISGIPASAQPVEASLSADQCSYGVPDFDGDGCADLAVGYPGSTVAGMPSAGQVEVLYGDPAGTFTKRRQVLSQGELVGGAAEPGDEFGSVLDVRDVNGDGLSDLQVGVPREDIGTRADAGAVFTIFGSPEGLGAGVASRLLRQGTGIGTGAPEAGDLFGAALSDGIVGVPGEDIGLVRDAGAVYAGGRTLSQAASTVAGDAEQGDRFGAAVSSFRSDCGLTFAVGVPGEDVGAVRDAGAVVSVDFRLGGTDVDAPICVPVSDFYSQDSRYVSGVSEAGDGFGAALTFLPYFRGGGRLVVGVPGEDLGSIRDAGLVQTMGHGSYGPFAGGPVLTQSGPLGAAETGDRFGSVLAAWQSGIDELRANVAVGVPLEDVGSIVDAGAVALAFIPWSIDDYEPSYQIVTQGALSGGAEDSDAGDRFGASLDIVGSLYWSTDSLYVGVPGEDLGEVPDAGAVLGEGGASLVLTSAQPLPGARFGAAIAGMSR